MDRSGATLKVRPWYGAAAVRLGVAILLVGGCGSSSAGRSLRSIRWSKVHYPVSCLPEQPPKPEEVEYSELPSGTPIAAVLVQCSTEDGTGGAGLLLYDQATSSPAPHLRQVLLDPTDAWVPGARNVTSSTRFLDLTNTSVSLKVAGYQGNVARCCANVFTTLTWRSNGHSFVESSVEPAHNR